MRDYVEAHNFACTEYRLCCSWSKFTCVHLFMLQVRTFYDHDKRLDKWTGDFLYLLAWADLMVVTADAIPEVSACLTLISKLTKKGM